MLRGCFRWPLPDDAECAAHRSAALLLLLLPLRLLPLLQRPCWMRGEKTRARGRGAESPPRPETAKRCMKVAALVRTLAAALKGMLGVGTLLRSLRGCCALMLMLMPMLVWLWVWGKWGSLCLVLRGQGREREVMGVGEFVREPV